MPEGTTSSRIARLVVKAARDAGVSEAEIRQIPGLPVPDVGADGIRVPTTSILRLWEVSESALVEGGTQVSRAWHPGRLASWDFVFSTADTLADAYGEAAGLTTAIADPEDVVTVTRDRHENLHVFFRNADPATPAVGPINEFALGLMLAEGQTAVGRRIVPLAVTLPGRPPSYHRHLVEEFGTDRIEFDAGRASFVLSAQDARSPLPGADPALAAILRAHARQSITANTSITWLDRMRAEIAQGFRDGGPSLPRVARRLAMSSRTLQRRLSEAATTWRDEVETVRREETSRLLRHTSLDVDSIASLVGYSDARALRRSIRRWYGCSPSGLRGSRTTRSLSDGALTQGVVVKPHSGAE